MTNTIILATSNSGKISEIRDLLSELPITLVTGEDVDLRLPQIDEDSDTLEGNARKKAETVFALTELPALADDTGLEVRALGNLPGVRSARYAGEECDPGANRRKLLVELRNSGDRAARFRSVIALALPGKTVLFEGRCDGRIALQERGSGGFGYDSIFVPAASDRTFAEMSTMEKNHISHRARALEKLRTFLSGGVLA